MEMEQENGGTWEKLTDYIDRLDTVDSGHSDIGTGWSWTDIVQNVGNEENVAEQYPKEVQLMADLKGESTLARLILGQVCCKKH